MNRNELKESIEMGFYDNNNVAHSNNYFDSGKAANEVIAWYRGRHKRKFKRVVEFFTPKVIKDKQFKRSLDAFNNLMMESAEKK